MRIPKNAEDFIEELMISIDLIADIKDLRIRQFTKVCEKVPGTIIFEGVLKIMTQNKYAENYTYQKEACKILKNINPKLEIDLPVVLKSILSSWNKSVPEFAFWLKENNGIDNLKQSITDLEQTELSPIERDKLNTFKWWLGIETIQPTQI